MSTVSASTTTPSIRTSSFIEEGLILDMALEQQTRFEERYRDSHFKGKTTKEWNKKRYEAEIETLKEKLALMPGI
jgi:hypothetical protein